MKIFFYSKILALKQIKSYIDHQVTSRWPQDLTCYIAGEDLAMRYCVMFCHTSRLVLCFVIIAHLVRPVQLLV